MCVEDFCSKLDSINNNMYVLYVLKGRIAVHFSNIGKNPL